MFDQMFHQKHNIILMHDIQFTRAALDSESKLTLVGTKQVRVKQKCMKRYLLLNNGLFMPLAVA